MKIFISGVFIFFITGLSGQTTELEKCGLDNNSNLNEYEVRLFNEIFETKKGDFNFSEKLIAYYTGTSGSKKSNKSNYFKYLKNGNNKEENIHNWKPLGTQLLILTIEEKEISGGYDAILVYWSKLIKKGKSRKRLVKRLK